MKNEILQPFGNKGFRMTFGKFIFSVLQLAGALSQPCPTHTQTKESVYA